MECSHSLLVTGVELGSVFLPMPWGPDQSKLDVLTAYFVGDTSEPRATFNLVICPRTSFSVVQKSFMGKIPKSYAFGRRCIQCRDITFGWSLPQFVRNAIDKTPVDAQRNMIAKLNIPSFAFHTREHAQEFRWPEAILVEKLFTNHSPEALTAEVDMVMGLNILIENPWLILQVEAPVSGFYGGVRLPDELYDGEQPLKPLVRINDKGEMVLYCHGRCIDNAQPEKRRGGSGVFFAKGSLYNSFYPHTMTGYDVPLTNQRTEILAIRRAVEMALFVLARRAGNASKIRKLKINTDSKYIVDAFLPGEAGLIIKWRRNNWKSKAGEKVKNRDLFEQTLEVMKAFKELSKATASHPIRIKWVPKLANRPASILSKLGERTYTRPDLEDTGDLLDDTGEPYESLGEACAAGAFVEDGRYAQMHGGGNSFIFLVPKKLVRESIEAIEKCITDPSEGKRFSDLSFRYNS